MAKGIGEIDEKILSDEILKLDLTFADGKVASYGQG